LEAKYFEKSDAGTLGGDHTWAMSEMGKLCEGPWTRYHMSKLANSCFAMAMHDKLQAKGSKVKAMAVDPGLAASELQVKSVRDGHMPSFMASMLMNNGSQSAADGAAPITTACFATDAESGDFYQPEKRATGPAMKTVSKGVPVKAGSEKLTTSQANKDMAWSKSIEYSGPFLE